ncbi:MAG: DegT/DnrJ/EryC1/StrS family aminotransferase [Methylophilaceae bacterium]
MNYRANSVPEVTFYPMEADGANYPKATIPLLPPASWSGWLGRKHVAAGSAFVQGKVSFIRGRYALAEAMRRAGAGPGKAVLLPAFHCRAMVEPALYIGAQPCFYPVMADLRPDFSAFPSLLSERGVPVAAMVITHYFGFPNDVDEAERFCAAHGIALIEDCAHALYGRTGERLLGTVGSYATASVWKFLPVRDGALLLDNTGGQPLSRTAQPLLAELKALTAMLQGWGQRVWRRHSLAVIDASTLREQAKLVAAQSKSRAVVPGLKEFSPRLVALAALRSSRWLMAHAAHNHIAQRRRTNYLKWLEGMRSVSGVKPLFPDLPEGVVPYAFPLLIDASGMGFHLLKMAGIPLLRWEDMAVTDCAISRDYRIRVLQLPCHQGLHADELDWMVRTVQALLSELD